MKQTAVEWLFLMMNNPNKDQEFANKLFEKAKEMEKEQIINAYEQAMETDIYNEPLKVGEQYYKETFKSE